MRDKFSKETAQRQKVWSQGRMPSKFKWSHSCQTSQKKTKAERIEEMVLMHVWLSGIKARYKLIFFRQGLLLK
jgi:hypothetical protein